MYNKFADINTTRNTSEFAVKVTPNLRIWHAGMSLSVTETSIEIRK